MRLIICLYLIIFVFPIKAYSSPEAIESLVSKRKVVRDVTWLNKKITYDWYKQNGFSDLWHKDGRVTSKVKEFLNAVKEQKDITSTDKYTSAIQDYINRSDLTEDQLAVRDLLITDRVIAYLSAVKNGLVNPRKVHRDWFYKSKYEPLVLLRQAMDAKSFRKHLGSLFPQNENYEKLKIYLKHFEKFASKGGWPAVTRVGKKWQVGDRGPHIETLRARLLVTGELRKRNVDDPQLFDENLAEAVKEFQGYHGLTADGVVGHNTFKALNVPAEKRVKQIKVNLERMRWLDDDLGSTHVFVNIPDYHLYLVQKGKTKLAMRSIVGTYKWKTPVFSDELEYLVINPRWNVPPKIAKKEMLPKIVKDNEYLTQKNFDVYQVVDGKKTVVDPATIDWSTAQSEDYLFSQRSGGGNSLGKIKFLFPNRHAVYFHDTPAKYLFKREVRTFSHGCVRISQPINLSKMLIGWEEEKIKKTIKTGTRKTVVLKEKIPVYLYYLTAFVNETGELQFRDDIYGYDKELARALKI